MDVNVEDARPRTKAEQREATVAALTAAARALFAERGYADVATEEIVRKAGVTRGALYHHFQGGKEDLFQRVLVEVSAELARSVAERAAQHDDPWEALIGGIDAFLDAAAAVEVRRIVLVDGPAVLGWDLWRALDADFGLGLVEAALSRAMAAERLSQQPVTPLAHVLLAAVEEAVMVIAKAPDPEVARTEMGAAIQSLLAGLRPAAP